MPENKVALFIDFDNIRIGIRQHFGGEIHPQKLMNKASKYGRVVVAKAYADFTGHPKEFQDRLLFAAGIEPVHAPSKLSGGRRQSSADMHMVIDMFLEAIDNPDIDTFILMTGDADFVRMVATLRRRFGRRVIVSGVQSTSTSLDLMNAADARDPITRQDCDMTGELGRMTRPLVTRADLDAQQAAPQEDEARPKGIGGIIGGIFKRRVPSAEGTPTPRPAAAAAPPAPRRMRATELRGGRTASAAPVPSARSRIAPGRSQRPAGPPAATSSTPRGRGRQPQELPPVGPGSEPDDFEKKLIQEIFTMPPGRSGFKTIKTIEEILRSKAGKLGGTRKEIPTRLERLEAMGLFKREMRPRGAGQVPAGDLVLDHPTVRSLTAGLTPAERTPREPRPARPARAASGGRAEAKGADLEAPAGPAVPETEAQPEASAEAEVEATDAQEVVAGPEVAAVDDGGSHFRWVSGVASSAAPDDEGTKTKASGEAARSARKPAAKRAPRKAATSKAPRSRTPKAAKEAAAETEGTEAADPEKEPTPA